MQFKVPQNVQREDKIVGPLTLKQLIICGIGFAVDYTIYTTLAKQYIWITWILPVAIVAIITMAFAFVRPLDLSFSKYIIRMLEFMLIPRKRFWIQGSAESYPSALQSAQSISGEEKNKEAKAIAALDKHKKLEEITKILNSQKSPQNLPPSDKL
jgi:hypothetical protein